MDYFQSICWTLKLNIFQFLHDYSRYTLLINTLRTSFSFVPIILGCDIEERALMTKFINDESRFLEKKSPVRLTNTVWKWRESYFPQCFLPYIGMGYFQRYTRPLSNQALVD